jgi:hypothetical protein
MANKFKRKRTKNSYKPSHLEMEIKLKDWIFQERALGVCISGLVIRVKAFEIERAICNQMNKPCLFKPSNGWMGNFLRRNRFVLRRITTTGRDLPENAIENILAFIADMEKTFGDQIDIDFYSIVNMDETFVYNINERFIHVLRGSVFLFKKKTMRVSVLFLNKF